MDLFLSLLPAVYVSKQCNLSKTLLIITRKCDFITQILISLHWLPMQTRAVALYGHPTRPDHWRTARTHIWFPSRSYFTHNMLSWFCLLIHPREACVEAQFMSVKQSLDSLLPPWFYFQISVLIYRFIIFPFSCMSHVKLLLLKTFPHFVAT